MHFKMHREVVKNIFQQNPPKEPQNTEIGEIISVL